MEYHTDLTTQKFPGITKAALEMSYCNGGINRDRSEKAVVRALDTFLASDGRDMAFDLPAISVWLAALDEPTLSTAVDGEQSEMEALMKTAPAGTDQLLSDIFNEVA